MKQTIVHLNLVSALFLAGFVSQALSQTQVTGLGWTANSNYGPAVATDGNYAYIAWVDSASSKIFFAQFYGDGFGAEQTVSGPKASGGTWTAESSATPAWGYDGSNFYLFWKGLSGTDIWYSEYSDGDWSQEQTVSGTDPNFTTESNVAPSATFYNYPLSMYVRGATPTSYRVWTSTLDDLEAGWSTQEVVSGYNSGTYAAPCPEQAPGSSQPYLPIFLTNSSNDVVVWVNSSYPVSGSGWTAESTLAPAAYAQPTDPGEPDVVFWTGLTEKSIWYSYNTGTGLGYGGAPVWAHQQSISGTATDAAPSAAQADGPSISVAILAWKKAGATTLWYMDPNELPELARATLRANKQ
jgi:hypothetical protein